MKQSPIEIDRQLETPATVENETQRVLREALALLDGGSAWVQGTSCNEDKTAFCAVGAIYAAYGRDPLGADNESSKLAPPVVDIMDNAARMVGVRFAGHLNDSASCFAEVEALFHRAIILAGDK